MMNQRDLRRAVRHGERELRAAGGDMLSQLRPKNILRDARDLALKFMRDDVLQGYIGPRIWAVLGVVLVFVLVGTVCAVDVMFKAGRYLPGILALLAGAVVWAGSVAGEIYVFAIWLEGRAARRDREERGIRVEMPAGFLAYLKYSRALVPWILVLACVALPLAIMATRAPLAALLLFSVALLAPFLFGKFDK
ncbi:MAG TPA: hypothetical protein VLV56_13900 [Burkholderiales bacterium]|nr:hypothetical protein [Burkholderiales bacterium]